MTDPQATLPGHFGPNPDGSYPAEQSPVIDPVRYVSWVHFGDPGWREPEPGVPSGNVTIAWALHFDGERVERKRGEVVRDPRDPKGSHAPLPQGVEAGDPWWMRAKEYRERMTSWRASGGAMDGTVVSFWVAGDEVEIVQEETTRFRVKVCGRDILTPLGYPVPAPPADTRYPVEVHMFVNRLTVGPMLDAEVPPQ